MKFNRTIPLVIVTGLLAVAGLLGFLSLPARAAPAAVLQVCQVVTCTYNTIQAAVDAAAAGDTIQVAGGTYSDVTLRRGFSQVVFLTKTVTIVGGYSPDFSVQNPISYPTILNPDGAGRGVTISGTFSSPISPTLSDLQITNGDANFNGLGGGIYVQDAAPTLAYLKIYQNIATAQFNGYGGGIYMSNSGANILESDIYSNTASTALGYSGSGGGIYITGGSPHIIGSHIANNVASTGGPGYGGGIALENDQAFLDSNAIMNNVASPAAGQPGSVFGGGVYMYQSLATLAYNRIEFNRAASGLNSFGQGGGLYMEQQSNATLNYNTIFANTASLQGPGSGGGINFNYANATLNGNKITENIASTGPESFHNSSGGGMFFSTDTSRLVNNIIARNFTNPNLTVGIRQGDGIMVQGTDAPILLHNTIYSNIGGDGVAIYVANYGLPIQITNTIIASQSVGVYNDFSSANLNGVLWFANGSDISGTVTSTVKNAVTGNPRFAADGFGFHITWPSAARNAGVPIDTSLYPQAAQDIDWEARPYPTDGLPDLGADELFMVWATLTPGDGGLMSYTDRPGMTITVDVPAGAVGVTTTLTCEPLDTLPAEPLPPDQLFAGRSFTLDAYQNMQLQQGFIFDQPVEVKVYYRDEDIVGIDEASLRLYYWDDEAGAWLDGANTCGTPAAYVRDPLNNFISVPICHLSRWDMHGVLPIEEENFLVYLPVAAKAP